MKIASMTQEKLTEILQAGDVDACVALFAKASEPERKKLAKTAVARLREVTKGLPGGRFFSMLNQFPDQSLRMLTNFNGDQMRAAQVATLATASLSQLKGLRGRAVASAELAEAVLSVRRPPWLGEWVESLCSHGTEHWPLVRRLVKLQLCPRPQHDNYTLGFITNMYDPKFSCLRDKLANEPELLDYDIWRLFELEPRPGIIGIFMHGGRPNGDQPWEWGTALLQLAADGLLPRARLLDASLGALERDLHEQWARFYARVHEGLQPTIRERTDQATRYAGLLGSRNGATVSFALEALAELERNSKLDAELLLGQIGPALAARTKGTIRGALGLLDRAAKRSQALRHRVASLALDALLHESADIHQQVLDLIERHGDPADAELGERLHERLEHVAASQRSRAKAWLERVAHRPNAPPTNEPDADLQSSRERAAVLDPNFAKLAGVPQALAAVERGDRELPALEFDGTEMPRLNPAARIEPIQDVDELIERVSSFLETGSDADEFERILDGISRLCNQRPPDFSAHSRPLLVRIDQLAAQPFNLHAALCALVKVWIDLGTAPINAILTFHVMPTHGALSYSLHGFLSRRVLALAKRVARGEAASLLGAPTHAGGWIDPRVLVKRARARQSLPFKPETADCVLALLRLAPDHRPVALADAGDLEGELGDAVRYALGSAVPEIGPTAALWTAAARARAPFADDWAVEARHRGLGPDAGFACRYTIRPGPHQLDRWKPLVLLDRQPVRSAPQSHDLPTVYLHEMSHFWGDFWPRWMATIWPLGREAYFAYAAEAVAGHDGTQTGAKTNQPFFGPLLDPDVPLRPMALLFLTIALSAKRPEESGLAVDALIASAADGRLDGSRLGQMMATLLPGGLVKVARWVKALNAAGRTSPLHARLVATAIEDVLSARPVLAPRDLSAFLDLLRELLIGLGDPVSPAVRSFLGEQNPTGKAAKLIQSLLSLQSNPACSKQPALGALAARIERAERWAGWRQLQLHSRDLKDNDRGFSAQND